MTTVIFLDSHNHPTCLEKFNGARRFAASRNWHLVRIITSACSCKIQALLKKHKAQGCIVNATRFLNKIPPKTFVHVPHVYLDTNPDLFNNQTPVIFHDSYGTGRRAANELLTLGMRQYYFVPYRFETFWSNLRWEGFANRLSECGQKAVLLPIRPASVAQYIMPQSGILTANDEMAEAILPILKRNNFRIPQDITVVSADDSDIARSNDLTSIRIDFEHAGYYAAEALAAVMENGTSVCRKSFGDVSIQYRDSTRHFAHTLPRIADAVAFIRANACNGITASSVVDFIGSPRRTAEDHFRLATGHSIHQEIQAIRLERVFSLLTAPNQSISSLTDLCGYGTPQSLRKAFRLHTGISMNEWRKRQQQSTTREGHVIDRVSNKTTN